MRHHTAAGPLTQSDPCTCKPDKHAAQEAREVICALHHPLTREHDEPTQPRRKTHVEILSDR
jgi:hypothetical protein